MGPLLDALLKSEDCVEVIGRDGRIKISNAKNSSACLPGAEEGSVWLDHWPETSRNAVLIAFDEAWDGRVEKFTAYRPDEEGADTWWDVSVSPIEAEGKVISILAVSRNITKLRQAISSKEAELSEAKIKAEERDLVSSEMRHRLKNQITAIESLARLTARAHEKTSDFMPVFSQRLMKLSLSQDLLSVQNYNPVPLEEAVQTITGIPGKTEQFKIKEMPDVAIGSNSLTTLALILGELTTNSLKYGALSEDHGHIELKCSEENGILTFYWREDAREPIMPGTTGSGQKLMTRMSMNSGVPFESDWHETGVNCRFGIKVAQKAA